MNRLLVVLGICQVLLQCRDASASSHELGVLATYKGGAVSDVQLSAAAFQRYVRQQHITPEEADRLCFADPGRRQRELKEIAFYSILAAQARERGFKLSPEQQGKLAEYRRLLNTKVMFLELIRPEIERARREWMLQVRAAWEMHKDELRDPAQFQFRFIFLGDAIRAPDDLTTYAERAREAYSRLKSGADFAEVARELSMSQPAEVRGAVIGPVSEQIIPPDRLSVLLKLKTGSFSAPFRTNKGYMILQLEKVKPGYTPSAEESTATLVKRGLVPRFVPELVVQRMYEQARQSVSYTVYEPNIQTRLPIDDNPLIASSSDWNLRMSDVVTSSFLRMFPEGVWQRKDVLARIHEHATAQGIAKWTEVLISQKPLYRAANDLIEQVLLGSEFFAQARKTGELPLLRHCGDSEAECQDVVLRAMNFTCVAGIGDP